MKQITKHICIASVLCLLLANLRSNDSTARTVDRDDSARFAGVLLGPCGSSGAEGPTGTNDDFTNLSVGAGFATPGGLTTSSATAIFKNTVANLGSSDDTFTITVPSVPEGFLVEVSTDFNEQYFTIEPSHPSISVPVAYGASRIFLVRVTAPAGLRILSSYDTVIRATSSIDPAISNETIDRLYTTFIRLEKTVRVAGGQSTGDIAYAAPGDEIEFAITYTNISTAGGVGNSLLTAYNLVINENGNAAPNNWGATTDHVVGASDSRGGYIVGDRQGSMSLTDFVTSVPAGQSGVFKFRRRIK